MKSDVVIVNNTGAGIKAAMEETSVSAQYRGLTKKESLRLRLLAEEMLGMLMEITGETEGKFWVECEGKKFMLHLAVHPTVTQPMRRELMSVSSDGRNAAAVGVMGKLRDMFERAFESSGVESSSYYLHGMMLTSSLDSIDPAAAAADLSMLTWSLSKLRYEANADKDTDADAMEVWDELEKSIIANLADEVSVSIRGREVEMIVYKDYSGK